MKFPSSNKFGTQILLWLSVCPVLSAAEIETNQPPLPATAAIVFDRDIRPIFETSCLRCHGPEKPKSHFRLDNRVAALKGGNENPDDIVPGDSSESLLIRYVARKVPDMEMPPIGKGDPLTPQQIDLLRTWIDQGADWTTTNQPPQPALTFAPTLRWINVHGNQSQFRELEGVNNGFSGGVEQFSFTDQSSLDGKLFVTGHANVPNQDFDVKLALDKTDLGFIHAGFDEWRKYYNDTGGYDPVVTPSQFSLNRDLYVDNGRAWIDFGLALPNRPQIVLGYEYDFKNGDKSMLDWGQVIENGIKKDIYPATLGVDEHTHILKFDVTHDFADWHLENNARLEFYSMNNSSEESQINSGGTTPDTFIQTRDNYQSTQGMDTLMLEKQIRDWWFVSGGFYYSKLEASDFFNQTTMSTVVPGSQLSSQQITLDRQSEIFSVASLFTPLTYLTFSLGSQNEWTRENGFGNSIPDLDFTPPVNTPASSNSDLFKASQDASMRFTKIPFTVLFADGRFDQESVSQFQEQDPGDPAADTETKINAMNYRYDIQTGFNTSPWRWVALNAQYQYQYSDSDYNYPVDVVDGIAGASNGYPGFILSRKIQTDGFETKLDLRPANWLKATLTYQITDTDYSSKTDPAFNYNGLGQPVSPGGPITDGHSSAQIYGFGATLTPIPRLYFSSVFTYTHSRTTTDAKSDPYNVPYEGDLYTVTTTATYALNAKTGLQTSYIFSTADYAENSAQAALPLGMNFTRHEVMVGLTRQLTKHLSGVLRYQFSQYSEPSSGNANNFTAQGVFATFVYKWQ
ncbi:MAG TPA: c-type cytochrome domain-containing protein [Verrucomicrobiae bacterium]|nr:c-type cytochrome domain-containing protein [Verrucomicrobiae bacterium]